MDIQQNIVLAPFTTFHIGGPADYFVKVNSSNELMDAVVYAKEKKLPFFVLGTGANILIGDKGFRGLVIKNEFKIVNNQLSMINVGSGATIEELICFTKEKGLSGLEHFAGIPSSVGGALWQNLHFLNPERTKTVFIGDILESAEILKTQNTQVFRNSDTLKTRKSDQLSFPSILKVDRDYFKFDYDYSILHDTHDIVLSATFRLSEKPKDEIQKTIDANLLWRKEKHPESAGKCSAGSIFKKIEGYGAGRLIEKVGLKGYQIGEAKISEKHANFIINTGNATAKNVRDLIELVQDKVKNQLGLEMIPEISFVGEF